MELDFTSNYEEFENFEEIYTELIQRTFKHLKLKFDPIISVSLVKRYARNLHCPRKSRMHLLMCNQEKAKATNIKRWLKKAEKVEHVMEWLRTFDLKDIRYCYVEDESKLKSFRTSINKFNRYEGYERSIFLTSQFIPEISLLRVSAILYRTAQ